VKAFYHADSVPMTIRTRLASRHLRHEPERGALAQVIALVERGAPATQDLAALRDLLASLGFEGPGIDRLIVEATAEVLRRLEFPERPARADALFLTPSPQEARRFAAQAGNRPVLHCCLAEPDDGAVLDWGLLAAALDDGGMPALVERVGRYWRGEPGPDPLWEFVTHGQVMVLQQER
jgi:hypothetical protein